MYIHDCFQNILKTFLVWLHGDFTSSVIAPDMSPKTSAWPSIPSFARALLARLHASLSWGQIHLCTFSLDLRKKNTTMWSTIKRTTTAGAATSRSFWSACWFSLACSFLMLFHCLCSTDGDFFFICAVVPSSFMYNLVFFPLISWTLLKLDRFHFSILDFLNHPSVIIKNKITLPS